MVKVCQQIVRQIGEQDETFLCQEPSLPSCCQAQAALVAAELLDFSASTVVVAGQEMAFGRQRKSGDVVAVAKLAIFEPPFDENTHRTTIIDRWCDLAQPDVTISIPATDFLGQGASPTVRHPLGDEMIVPSQEPTDMFIASCTTVEAPNRPFALRP